jgi:hypothetical protein
MAPIFKNSILKNYEKDCKIAALILVLGCMTAVLVAAEQTSSNSPQRSEVLNNDAVVQLKQLGLGESVIMEKIKNSPCDFDVSLNGLKQLKAAGVSDGIITTMLSAKSIANGNGNTAAAQPADRNDPNSPHDAGIWLYEEVAGKQKMTELEPSVYSQSQTGSAMFMGFGATVKQQAVIRSAHAELSKTNRQ